MELKIIIVLAALLCIQQVFWTWQVHRLINKLMSRNYFEYQTTSNLKPEKKEEQFKADLTPTDDLAGLTGLM